MQWLRSHHIQDYVYMLLTPEFTEMCSDVYCGTTIGRYVVSTSAAISILRPCNFYSEGHVNDNRRLQF